MSPSHPETPDAPAFDMSITVGQNTADKFGITREDMDAWAYRSSSISTRPSFGTIRADSQDQLEYLYTTFLRNYQGWYSQDQFTYREDPTRAIERSMINFANLSLKAVRIVAQQPALDKARQAGTGPDVLDVVSPILVG